MVHEAKLSSVLSDFARTMVTDFPIQAILDALVERIVTILPVTAAGVTLISEGQPPHYIAASDASALRFERLQSQIEEGPCLLAFHSGESVAVPNLALETRFPKFSPAAEEAGLAAVFTFPLRHGDARVLGALDLYRDTPGVLDEPEMEAAQTLADVAAAYLLNAKARDDAGRVAEQFQHTALHDALTGLPNRLLLKERIAHAADRARRTHTAAAVLFIDLDRFKPVNDSHGHHVGDKLLVKVAQRLWQMGRASDTLSRVSGDEFVLLCEDLDGREAAEAIATRINEAFAQPFFVENLRLFVTVSIGIAFAGPGEEVSEQLVIDADVAMYQAKHRGGDGHRVIDAQEARRSNDRSRLETDLRTAMSNGTLAVAYQPIVRTADGLVTGVEALLRWTHAERGPVSPKVAIELAERSGLINAIGLWVLEQSINDRAEWLNLPHQPLELSVNVSGRQLFSDGFRSSVEKVLSNTDMEPGKLILELTENVFMEDSERAATVLADFKAMGVRLALDDFGTGYSSLSYLRRLPVDIVKIDRGFISDAEDQPHSGAIVKAITDLTHALGLTVTAEGIESQAQCEAVMDFGCDSSQGYYYAKPLTAPALRTQLGATANDPLRLPGQGSPDWSSR